MGEDDSPFADMSKVGRGVWFSIHIMALHVANTSSGKKEFCKTIRAICDNYKCGNCKSHCQEYIRNHPPEEYMNVKSEMGEEIGLFKWSWMFHNAVNSRIGKPVIDYNTIYNLFKNSESQVCYEGCGVETNNVTLATNKPMANAKTNQLIQTVPKGKNTFQLISSRKRH